MCHQLKKTTVVLKFIKKKVNNRFNSNKWKSSPAKISGYPLKLSGKFFIGKSVCYENQQLAFKCCQLKNSKKIYSTWFWNNGINIRVTPNGEIHQIFHTTDIEKLLGIKNLDNFINNTSFYRKFIRIFHTEFLFICQCWFLIYKIV